MLGCAFRTKQLSSSEREATACSSQASDIVTPQPSSLLDPGLEGRLHGHAGVVALQPSRKRR
jgi:hypothetical protein